MIVYLTLTTSMTFLFDNNCTLKTVFTLKIVTVKGTIHVLGTTQFLVKMKGNNVLFRPYMRVSVFQSLVTTDSFNHNIYMSTEDRGFEESADPVENKEHVMFIDAV